MSLFIRVDRIEEEGGGTLVRVRELVAQLGEDSSGIFTCQNAARVFMSVFRCRGEWFLQADVEDSLLNDSSLPLGDSRLLRSGDQVVFEGRSYHFFPSGVEEEILAVSQKKRGDLLEAIARENSVYGELVLELADVKESYPLFSGVELVVGQAADVPILITLAGVAGRHFSVKRSEAEVIVQALEGEIIIQGMEPSTSYSLKHDATIRLLPGSLEVGLKLL